MRLRQIASRRATSVHRRGAHRRARDRGRVSRPGRGRVRARESGDADRGDLPRGGVAGARRRHRAALDRQARRRRRLHGDLPVQRSRRVEREVERAKDAGAVVVWEGEHAGAGTAHFHPRGLGAIASLDGMPSWREWVLAGPEWREHVRTATASAIAGAELASSDPEALAQRWSDCSASRRGARATTGSRSRCRTADGSPSCRAPAAMRSWEWRSSSPTACNSPRAHASAGCSVRRRRAIARVRLPLAYLMGFARLRLAARNLRSLRALASRLTLAGILAPRSGTP